MHVFNLLGNMRLILFKMVVVAVHYGAEVVVGPNFLQLTPICVVEFNVTDLKLFCGVFHR